MAVTTGQSFYNDFQNDSGFAFTGYLSPIMANSLFEEAFVRVMAEIFINGKQDITNKDSLSTLVRTNVVINPVINNVASPLINNQFYVEPLSIYNVTATSGGGNTTYTYQTFLPHNFVITQNIIIQGVAGFTGTALPNGYVQVATTPTPYTFTVIVAGTLVGAYTVNSGICVAQGGQLYWQQNPGVPTSIIGTDYWRLLTIKSQYFMPVNQTPSMLKWSVPLFINNSTGNGVDVVVNFSNYNNIRTGDYINITGITGNTNANGNFYIQMYNELSGGLFTDKYLQDAVTGNGTFGGSGVISRIYYNYCKPYLSDEKISPLNKPNARNPLYENANSLIKLYPQDFVVQQCTIDYVGKPFQIYNNLSTPSYYFIESTDNTVNLENYYPKDFLILIKQTAVQMYLAELRDGNGIQMNTETGQ